MTEQHQGLGAAIISNMEQVCAKLSAFASDYLRERVSDIRDISEQLLHITWPELKPRNNLVLEKTDYSGSRGFNPKPVFEPRFKKSCRHDSGENWAHLAYPDSGPRLAIPVLSGCRWMRLPYAGQPAVLDAQCGVLAINPNDAVSGYYQVATDAGG